MEEDLKNWMSIIRSCVISSKDPLTVNEIKNDTKMLEGEDIPFEKFQFCTLEEMLRKTPGLQVFYRNGQSYVKAVPTKETAHLTKMISRQKSGKTKKNKKETLRRLYAPSCQDRDEVGPTSQRRARQHYHPYMQHQKNYSLENEYEESYTSDALESSMQYSVDQNLTKEQEDLFELLWSTKDPCLQLLSYTIVKKLPEPDYKNYWTKFNKVYSTVKVHQKTYTSFQNIFHSKEEADCNAASIALKDIAENISREHKIQNNLYHNYSEYYNNYAWSQNYSYNNQSTRYCSNVKTFMKDYTQHKVNFSSQSTTNYQEMSPTKNNSSQSYYY